MSPRPTTPAEAAAYERGYREGVQTVLDFAGRSADALEATSKRKLHEGFAVAALRGLVEACVNLLIKPEAVHKEAA